MGCAMHSAWEGERFTVGTLLELFVVAQHAWSPTTLVSHSHGEQAAPGRVEPVPVGPVGAGGGADRDRQVAVISGRYAVLHAVISRAIAERLLRFDPLVGMHAPPRPCPRKHLPPELVCRLIGTAEQRREKAAAGLDERPGSRGAQSRSFRADQTC
jgi:hypothetical protein